MDAPDSEAGRVDPDEDRSAAQVRDSAARQRDLDGRLRDTAGDLRDSAAGRRDRQATSRTTVRGVHVSGDRPARGSGAAAGDQGSSESDRAAAAGDRTAAADDRAAAASDRTHALANRTASAQDRHHASLDKLTDVFNRQAGLLELELELARVRRAGEPLVLAFVDVDQLKLVNDHHGHGAGDQLLTAVARTLKAALRSHDLVFRYGGDEFLCVVRDVDITAVGPRFGRINALLAASAGHGSVTIGLAQLRPVTRPSRSSPALTRSCTHTAGTELRGRRPRPPVPSAGSDQPRAGYGTAAVQLGADASLSRGRHSTMSQCVVVGCEQEGEVIAGLPTPWGAWEYWVCADHKAQIDDGGVIHDNADGRTITVD